MGLLYSLKQLSGTLRQHASFALDESAPDHSAIFTKPRLMDVEHGCSSGYLGFSWFAREFDYVCEHLLAPFRGWRVKGTCRRSDGNISQLGRKKPRPSAGREKHDGRGIMASVSRVSRPSCLMRYQSVDRFNPVNRVR